MDVKMLLDSAQSELDIWDFMAERNPGSTMSEEEPSVRVPSLHNVS